MKAAIDAEETEKRQLEAEKQKIEERLQVQIREAAIKVIFLVARPVRVSLIVLIFTLYSISNVLGRLV